MPLMRTHNSLPLLAQEEASYDYDNERGVYYKPLVYTTISPLLTQEEASHYNERDE